MARLLPGLFQEGVDLICGGPLLRILVPTLSDHAPQLGVAVLDHRPRLLAVQELLEHDLWVQAHLVKWPAPRAQIVHDQAERVDIHLLIILLMSNNLRSHVQPAAHSPSHGCIGLVVHVPQHFADAKVRHLDVQVLGQQEVQRLQISVDDGRIEVVQKGQGSGHREAPLQHLLQGRAPVLHLVLLPLEPHVVLQVPAFHELGHEHHGVARVQHGAHEEHKVRVPQRGQHLDLFQQLLRDQLLLVQLQGHRGGQAIQTWYPTLGLCHVSNHGGVVQLGTLHHHPGPSPGGQMHCALQGLPDLFPQFDVFGMQKPEAFSGLELQLFPLNLGSIVLQKTAHLKIPSAQANVQWRLAQRIQSVHTHAMLQQNLDHLPGAGAIHGAGDV
mmetsp:Transcript_126124/g.299510  ORF Transcript_126124/g.299510 Transcript_126124/m.299510 type:complete len:384 (+) Transcript_126124:429-1580(+)